MARFPRLKISRKIAFAIAGTLALMGGSGAAAFYVGADVVLGSAKPAPTGVECTTVLTMISKTPSNRLWLRKYIKTDKAVDGEKRLITALRIAGLAAKANKVDLVQVNVLDPNGPSARAEMRGRTIGAQATIGLDLERLPELKPPVIGKYYDGVAGSDGEYHGALVAPGLDNLRTLIQAMSDAEKVDCKQIAAS